MMVTESMRYEKKQLNGDTLTPVVIYKRLTGEKKFLLESSVHHAGKGRYSIIGANPYKELIGKGRETLVKVADQKEKVAQKPLEVLKEQISGMQLPIDFPFYGGAVGYMAYDSIRQYEAIGDVPKDPIGMPEIHFMFYEDMIVYDHKHQQITLLAVDSTGSRSEEMLRSRLDEMEKEITTFKDIPDAMLAPVRFQPETDQATFMQMVEDAKAYIKAGDVFQIVLSQRLTADFTGDAFSFYRKLRASNPSPYMFFLDFDDYTVLGASPESLIKTSGNTVTANPIAGSRPRGKTRTQDERLTDELLADEKELAEHRMLVDLSRNDLGRVCKVGTVELTKYMAVEKYQHIMHIVSEVQGELADGMTGLDALIAALPAGTVSGAPKIRAMELINQFEKKKRGLYAGAVGYINMNGDLDLALAIRTMIVKDKKAYVQTGAGLVYDSDPETEYHETLHKAKSLTEVGLHDSTDR
ncbi:anthranilate synthase component 1 [Terribacillus halophilus]|uniref:Anthranilate synthase component 1 n=1 Tax=Terribacillus halophilus TaxID=361279 RepID=A0A1G6I0Q7_9BACI|nr:anthranilate synthase component I [Terribacillus halophilus]SDC00112.1 anthranilate synthase component 1 [Terribacillus halophilus]